MTGPVLRTLILPQQITIHVHHSALHTESCYYKCIHITYWPSQVHLVLVQVCSISQHHYVISYTSISELLLLKLLSYSISCYIITQLVLLYMASGVNSSTDCLVSNAPPHLRNTHGKPRDHLDQQIIAINTHILIIMLTCICSDDRRL